jgi:hypothetical protein
MSTMATCGQNRRLDEFCKTVADLSQVGPGWLEAAVSSSYLACHRSDAEPSVL